MAAFYHFQPSELWAMEVEELAFWNVQAARMQRSQ